MTDASRVTAVARQWTRWGWYVLWGIGGLGALVAVGQIALHVWYFLHPNAIVWDTAIYLAMGRGLLNGLTLYEEIFDLKPPGVFFLAALSLKLFGDARLGNFLGAFALVVFPIAFLRITWPAIRREQRVVQCTIGLLAVLLGAFWSAFQAIEGGPWQTEAFGAVFALWYVYRLFTPLRNRTWQTISTSLALLGAIGMKEPFVISCAAAALLVSERPRDFARNFLLPLLLALTIGVIVMGILQILVPYMTFYLPSVLQYRGRAFGPLWMRAFAFSVFSVNLGKVSPVASLTVIILAITGIVLRHRPLASKRLTNVWKIFGSIAGLYGGMLAVGVAGDYQSHHFVFFAPVFFALSFLLLRHASQAWTPWWIRSLLSSLLLLLSLTFLVPSPIPDPRYRWEKFQALLTGADHLDAMLTACSIDRYLSVIGNEIGIHGFTTHSPSNHSLFWELDNAIQYGQTFLDLSIGRLSQAEVLVVQNEGFTPMNDIGKRMAAYILSSFSLKKPACADSVGEIPGHFVLFRVKDEPLDLQIEFIDERG